MGKPNRVVASIGAAISDVQTPSGWLASAVGKTGGRMRKHLLAAILTLAVAVPAMAADNVKIGFVTTLSGPAGVIGKHMKDASELALGMLGGKIGGLPAQILYGDDQFKPDVGRQVADEMLKRDAVDFMTGYIWSNVLLAVYQPVIQSGKILISANAGPHDIAGS